ncbi:MAG TPA: Gfo/Idh/MocA family oxidoreductase [Candidatus Hydrogenedentes bacterium]|nr:Gfo/Idh/MocA family oxidoreductase [Candidatus Hydrogenedentota bacterium]HRT20168.1 Gfo/Idh/MocA family oxidoreductase [Candidatus Hydrogenedentota bacterium]HRT63202.1 Gfo/Idh/MocA family oxidoreductase [Candidatus Hydrogenedentota bacterium]
MINVGIIGCGRIADLHALGYRGNPDARILAVCDENAERAEQRRIEWGADRSYSDYRQLLHNPDIDAVEVLTPYETHEKIVMEAFAAEKHVAVQKPMTTSLKSADRMVLAAEMSRKVFKVTECYLTYPPIVFAKRLVESGAIGEPLGMRIKYVCSPLGGWNVPAHTIQQQIAKSARGFGLETFDHGHHEWATAWYLLGAAERVSAWIDSTDGVIDCPATIMWKCIGGKRYGVCDFIYAPELQIPSEYYSNDEWYEITGSRGIIQIHRGTGHIVESPIVSLFNEKGWTHYTDIPADWSEGFTGATRNFIAAILGREAPLLTGVQARAILQFAFAIARSAAKHREVYLAEFDHPFPWLHTWRQRRRNRRDVIVGRRPRLRIGDLFVRTAPYARQAHDLMRRLQERFDPASAKGWNAVIGLELLPEAGVEGGKYGLYFHDGACDVREGELPPNADLTLHATAGLWAAILLGKIRIEAAALRNRIQYEGHAEQALRLRTVFRL